MTINQPVYINILEDCARFNATLVAVSKIQPNSKIQELYQLGHRDFGENYVQELLEKQQALPPDIRWHFIGHLQTNKAKYIVPFVHLIHGVDSLKLLKEINKQAAKANRKVQCLLQVYIASEETKFGLDYTEAENILQQKNQFENASIIGLMGMASNTSDKMIVKNEFEQLATFFKKHFDPQVHHLSMGMSGDYLLALTSGSNMVRIGSSIFGFRVYQ